MATEHKPMRSDIFTVLVRRYESAIMDAQLKIDLINEQPQLIPEHVDLTGEIDKLLKEYYYKRCNLKIEIIG